MPWKERFPKFIFCFREMRFEVPLLLNYKSNDGIYSWNVIAARRCSLVPFPFLLEKNGGHPCLLREGLACEWLLVREMALWTVSVLSRFPWQRTLEPPRPSALSCCPTTDPFPTPHAALQQTPFLLLLSSHFYGQSTDKYPLFKVLKNRRSCTPQHLILLSG